MWCRYCDARATSRWRTGPCGVLCNAHWKQWKKGHLDLPTVEPTSAICPLERNDYVYTKKRKRTNPYALVQAVHWYRGKWKQRNAFLDAFDRYRAQHQQLHALRTEGTVVQVLQYLRTMSPLPTMGTLSDWLAEPAGDEMLGDVSSEEQRLTDAKLSTCSTVMMLEVQSLRNRLRCWYDEEAPLIQHRLRCAPDLGMLRERYSMAREEEATQHHLEELWWRERHYDWTLSWAPHLTLALRQNDILDHPDLQEHLHPHSLSCFHRLRPLDDRSWLVVYNDQEKRLVRFHDLAFFQEAALFYHHCARVPGVQHMDFLFVYDHVGWMVTPYVPGGDMASGHPTADVLRQLIHIVSSAGRVHGALHWNNLWWTGSHRQCLLLRKETPADPRFTPPNPCGTVADDIWAMGVLFHHLHTGQYPLTPLQDIPGGDLVISGMIQRMLHPDPAQRQLDTTVEACLPLWSQLRNDNTLVNEEHLVQLFRALMRQKRRMRWDAGVYTIDRTNVIGNVFAAFEFLNLTDERVAYHLEFRYQDEPGEGSGPTRDVYQQFFQEVRAHGLFDPAHGLPSSCPTCDDCPYQHKYELLGTILAKVVLDDLIVPVPMCRAWTRFLMNKQATTDDLREVSQEEFNMIYCLQQEPNITSFRIPWHAGRFVTNENKTGYIQERTRHFLFQGRRNALRALRKGFTSFRMARQLLHILPVARVHSILFGTAGARVDDVPFSWNNGVPDQTKRWFLNWLSDSSVPLLLRWCTGSSRLSSPASPITIDVSETLHYPQAQTCSRTIFLPTNVADEPQLRRLLDTAVQQLTFSFT